MFRGQSIGKEQALQKIRHYCGYQERSHQEVKEKLYGYSLRKQEVEEILSTLIEDNYLNEERFAIHFAGGKFRMKQWGRVKIIQALKEKRVSTYCIRKAMEQIDEDAYQKLMLKLAEKKWTTLKKEKNRFVKLQKTKNFLLQRGFEANYVSGVLKQLGDGGN